VFPTSVSHFHQIARFSLLALQFLEIDHLDVNLFGFLVEMFVMML
jgi:hypothetical protein